MMNFQMLQFRYLFDIFSGSTPESGKGHYWDGEIPWITPEDVSQIKSNSLLLDTRRKITEEGYENAGANLAPKQSIVLTKRAPIGNVAILGIEACCNQGCFLIVPKLQVESRFYYYYLSVYKSKLQILGRGSTFMELSFDEIKSLKVPRPNQKAQQEIVNYLDRETAHIDALIQAKENLLAMLAEKRQSLITQAVTRGLDTNVPLKASGVDWLGDVPEHWEVKKLKYIADLKSGDFITADSITEEGLFPVYGGNGLRGYTSNKTHSGNYVLIGRQGALCGNINYAQGEFWASEHAVVCIMLGDDNVLWLGELLRIMNLNQYSVSAAQPGLSVEVIKNLIIPVPPIEEQNLITTHINSALLRIDSINDATRTTISLLTERRSALITAAVTGQITIPQHHAHNETTNSRI